MLKQAKHKSILVQILKDIYSNKKISSFLGFKGGTAAYLFYNLTRFSVDIDLDLLDEEKNAVVFDELKKIIEKYGKVKESKRTRYNIIFVISYQEDYQNIKVEVNKRIFGSEYEIKSYLGISMLVMKKEDMFANKLVAMNERMERANRDIYDVWFFLKDNWDINKEIVENRMKMTFKEALIDCINKLDKKPDRHILHGMGELLDDKTKTWVKKNLKQETLFLLKLRAEEEKE